MDPQSTPELQGDSASTDSPVIDPPPVSTSEPRHHAKKSSLIRQILIGVVILVAFGGAAVLAKTLTTTRTENRSQASTTCQSDSTETGFYYCYPKPEFCHQFEPSDTQGHCSSDHTFEKSAYCGGRSQTACGNMRPTNAGADDRYNCALICDVTASKPPEHFSSRVTATQCFVPSDTGSIGLCGTDSCSSSELPYCYSDPNKDKDGNTEGGLVTCKSDSQCASGGNSGNSSSTTAAGADSCQGQCTGPTNPVNGSVMRDCGSIGLGGASGSCSGGAFCCSPKFTPNTPSQGAFVYCRDGNGPIYPMKGIAISVNQNNNANPGRLFQGTGTNGRTFFAQLHDGSDFAAYVAIPYRNAKPGTPFGSPVATIRSAGSLGTFGPVLSDPKHPWFGKYQQVQYPLRCYKKDDATNDGGNVGCNYDDLKLPTGQSYANLTPGDNVPTFPNYTSIYNNCRNSHWYIYYSHDSSWFCDDPLRNADPRITNQYDFDIPTFANHEYGMTFHFSNCTPS